MKQGYKAKNFVTGDQWSAWSLNLLKEHAAKNLFNVLDINARQFGVKEFNALLEVLPKMESKQLGFRKSIVNQRDAEQFWEFFLEMIRRCQFGFIFFLV